MSYQGSLLQPTEESLGRWLQSQRPARGKVLATVLHHTWNPTAVTYRGRSSLESVWRHHTGTRGWRNIGANAYAAPDGVWTARPLSDSNWSHAAVPPGMAWARVEPEARVLMQGNRSWMNYWAFGLESFANWDVEDPYGKGRAAQTFENAMRTLTLVHRHFDIPANRLFFHADVSYKTCPGKRLNRTTVRNELQIRLRGGETVADTPDVDDYAAAYVDRARAEGLVSGYPDGTIRGREPTQRQDTIVMLIRLLDKLRAELRAVEARLSP